MRKKLFALLAALALCLSLTACGGTQDDTDDLAGGDWRLDREFQLSDGQIS